MSRVVEHNATIYLRDMAHFKAMNEVWDAWVVDGFEPARACVEAKMARDTLLVEMSVTAAKI
jgi:enamine deaminase RidA (YjgF/YER057c/UK114 family)